MFGRNETQQGYAYKIIILPMFMFASQIGGAAAGSWAVYDAVMDL